VSDLLIGLLSALVATNPPVALSNFVARTTGVSIPVTDPNDPVEKEYRKLVEDDDAAQQEVDQWIRDNKGFQELGAGVSDVTLRSRVRERLDVVRKAYESFLQRHPDHARARLAFGSFLMDTQDEEEAVRQMEKARELDPKNPAAWNNLANHYGHRGSIRKAFEYYAKAIELNPTEPVYYQNLATSVYLFRKDAMEFYQLTEPQVFDRALELYRKAIRFNPDNFVLATDYAQTYYGIRPMRHAEAIEAWLAAQKIAPDDKEREGVELHLARIKLDAERFAEVREHLGRVTNEVYATLKMRLKRNLEEREGKSQKTNAPPAGAKN
jgi:tetratricopeptide (TPR) repeat protein